MGTPKDEWVDASERRLASKMNACSVVPLTHERCVSVVHTLLMPAEQ